MPWLTSTAGSLPAAVQGPSTPSAPIAATETSSTGASVALPLRHRFDDAVAAGDPQPALVDRGRVVVEADGKRGLGAPWGQPALRLRRRRGGRIPAARRGCPGRRTGSRTCQPNRSRGVCGSCKPRRARTGRHRRSGGRARRPAGAGSRSRPGEDRGCRRLGREALRLAPIAVARAQRRRARLRRGRPQRRRAARERHLGIARRITGGDYRQQQPDRGEGHGLRNSGCPVRPARRSGESGHAAPVACNAQTIGCATTGRAHATPRPPRPAAKAGSVDWGQSCPERRRSRPERPPVAPGRPGERRRW